MSSIVASGVRPFRGRRRVERHRELGPGAAFPADLDARAPRILVHGDDHLGDQRAQQFLALTCCRRAARPTVAAARARCRGAPRARRR